LTSIALTLPEAAAEQDINITIAHGGYRITSTGSELDKRECYAPALSRISLTYLGEFFCQQRYSTNNRVTAINALSDY